MHLCYCQVLPTLSLPPFLQNTLQNIKPQFRQLALMLCCTERAMHRIRIDSWYREALSRQYEVLKNGDLYLPQIPQKMLRLNAK